MKKIRVLVADDRKTSAESIIACAITHPNGSSEKSQKHLDLIYNVLEIRHVDTVGDAVQLMNQHPDEPFDLAFVDIDFKETNELEPDTTLAQYPAERRGLELLRYLRRNFPETKIKVHTLHGNARDLRNSLVGLKIQITDLFDLVADGDYISVHQNLADEFPELLQDAARNLYYLATELPQSKIAIDAELRQYAHERSLDHPIQSMGGFTLRTLLIGWAKIKPVDSEHGLEIVLPDSLDEVLSSFRAVREAPEQNEALFDPAGNLRRINPRTNEPGLGYRRLMAMRATADYHIIRQEIETTTRAIVLEFLSKGWGKATNRDIANGTLPDFENPFTQMLVPPYPAGLDEDLGQVNGGNNTRAMDALKRILICRLVYLSLYGLKNQGICFVPLNMERVMELCVLAAIRNKPTEVKGNHRETIDRYFSLLLGFRKPAHQAVILPRSILPEEQAWIQHLQLHFPGLIAG